MGEKEKMKIWEKYKKWIDAVKEFNPYVGAEIKSRTGYGLEEFEIAVGNRDLRRALFFRDVVRDEVFDMIKTINKEERELNVDKELAEEIKVKGIDLWLELDFWLGKLCDEYEKEKKKRLKNKLEEAI